MSSIKHIFLLSFLLLMACQNEVTVVEEESTPKVIQPFLPLIEFDLSGMSELVTAGDNWSIAGGVNSDFQVDFDLRHEAGTGLLLNAAPVGSGASVSTTLEHGDIELELEVLVPKGSNSGLYFQSRYELQIIDSEGQVLTPASMGGIYYQGDDKPGVAPSVDAARAPGLWQRLKVLFRAPKFDDKGKKIADATFEHVYLNGIRIHKNVSIPQPTLGAINNEETASAPLMIQGDHGPVAFRNIRYKVFSDANSVELNGLTYKLYKGKYPGIPDFSTLDLIEEGEMDNFDDLTKISGQNDDFALDIEGVLRIPIAGEYLIETSVDDGGDLYIDDELIVHNEGEPGGGTVRAFVNLESGEHRLRQTFYQQVWGANIKVKIEGPGIEKIELPIRKVPEETKEWQKEKLLEVIVEDRPEIIRAFVDHQGVKQTHVVSVGMPDGINYSFNTRTNQLMQLWKGKFANVAEMWINRGGSQRLRPMNASLQLPSNDHLLDFKPIGYVLDQDGIPVFSYKKGKLEISEKVTSSDRNTAIKTVSANGDSFLFDIAKAKNIEKLEGGWHSIDGRYYIKVLKSADYSLQNDTNGEDILSITLSSSDDVQFEIKW